MPEDEIQNPSQDGAELELTPKVEETPVVELPKEEGGDPLDSITDVETIRSEAKKFRAISQRLGKPVEKKEEAPKLATEGEYMTKADFFKSNEKKAINLATVVSESDPEDVKTLKKDLTENWSEVAKFFTSRRGKDTPEDVLEDIKDAYILFRNRNPRKEETPNIAAELASTLGTVGRTVTPPSSNKVDDPRFSRPKGPDQWYPKNS